MAKTKTGYVPAKGKPSGSGRETHGLKNAFAVNDLETDIEIAEKYRPSVNNLLFCNMFSSTINFLKLVLLLIQR